MTDVNEMALEAARDSGAFENFIRDHQQFILRCASKTTRRYITTSDDEWSIALSAFSEAVENFSEDKGAFISFAELVIKRRMMDYFRKQDKYSNETSVAPDIFNGDVEDEDTVNGVQVQVVKKLSSEENEPDTVGEIQHINERLQYYGFSFFDLSDCSPKSKKTKKSCAMAVKVLLNQPVLLQKMQDSRQLPMKEIVDESGVTRKILERHRKYIVAAAEIMCGDYPYIATYLENIREEMRGE